MNALPLEFVLVTPGLLWNNALKVSWPVWKVPFMWQTKSLTYLRHCYSKHTCTGLKNRYYFEMFTLLSWSNMLTWRAIALRSTFNSLHSWYKLPSTLTTYHTAYLFSFTLPWYVAYSRPRFSAKFNYVERGLKSICNGYGKFPCAVLWRNPFRCMHTLQCMH